MAYRVKTVAPCTECGVDTNRRLNKTRVPCCLECAIERNTAGIYNLASKRGPRYDLWLAGMRKAIDLESTTRGGGTNTTGQAG